MAERYIVNRYSFLLNVCDNTVDFCSLLRLLCIKIPSVAWPIKFISSVIIIIIIKLEIN